MTDRIPITESRFEYSSYPIERPTLMIKVKSHAEYEALKQQIISDHQIVGGFRKKLEQLKHRRTICHKSANEALDFAIQEFQSILEDKKSCTQ